MVYEYANRLVADGFKVDIVYSGSIFWKQKSLRFKLSNCVRYIERLVKGYSCRSWFNLDVRVKEHLTLSMNYRHVPKDDIYVATSPYTAWYLNEYPTSDKRKFYLIQDKEDWGPGLCNLLEATYHMKLKKLVISNWLKQMLQAEHNERSMLLPNGFDFEKFHLNNNNIETRDKYVVSMLYHTMSRKRTDDAFAALDIVKKRYPQLKVNIFGASPCHKSLPDWYTYYYRPNAEIHNRINNESAIFIGSSKVEGWGLTIGEAMICGEAVCCTDNAGYREMAFDGKTALISPVCNPQALAENVIRLIEDDALRIKIANEGNKYIQHFRWDDSYRKFKSLVDGVSVQ